MKYNLTELTLKNQSKVACGNIRIGNCNLNVHSYVIKTWDGTYRACYRISGDIGWAGGVGIKNFSVNEKATAEEAFKAVVRKAERWIAKYIKA